MKSKINKIIAICLTASVCVGMMFVQAPVKTAEAASPLIPIYMDRSYSFEERAADMVARMTSVTQKAGQMFSGVSAAVAANPTQFPTGLKAYGWWNECLHGVSRIHSVTGSSPPTIANATSYPISFSMGGTWDKELQHRVATEISAEARQVVPGSDRMLTFYSPTVNLARDPRWGRTDEAMSEDPYLTSEIAGAFVNGIEGKDMNGNLIDPNGYYSAVATIKHYFANNSENNRTNGEANLTEQEAREYYTYAFRRIIQNTNVTSVMSSYNRLQIKGATNSVIEEFPAAISAYGLHTLLRQTFGFTGYVTSDCDSVGTVVAGSGTATANQMQTSGSGHGWRAPTYTVKNMVTGANEVIAGATTTMAKSQAQAWSIMAGADLECNGGISGSTTVAANINTAVTDKLVSPYGTMSENAVDVDLWRLFTTRLKLGEFDDKTDYTLTANPSLANSSHLVSWYDKAIEANTALEISPTDGARYDTATALTMTPSRLALAEEAAAKSMILLKNNPVAANGNQPLLPLPVPRDGRAFKVGVYSAYTTTVYRGGYSSTSSANGQAKQTNLINGIRAAVTAINPNATVSPEAISTGATLSAADTTAIARANNYDYVIVFVGDASAQDANEGSDRDGILLHRNQSALVQAVAAVNPKMITVLQAYTSLDTAAFEDVAPAMLYSSFGGDRMGKGVADVIVGNYNPSGRTSTIWYTGVPNDNAVQTTANDTSNLNSIRSYRLSPGIDGPWQNTTGGTTYSAAYTYNPNRNIAVTDWQSPGRTYMYYTKPVLYPFGHGLSYTTFAFSNLRVSSNSVSANGNVTLSFDIRNTGSVAGNAVPELYVKTPPTLVAADSTYAIKRLRAFEQVPLNPGQTKTVTFTVAIQDIAFWSTAAKKFEVVWDKGAYDFQISTSSDDKDVKLSAPITITGPLVEEPRVLTFQANTQADKAADIPERLIYAVGDTIIPNATLCMNNDVLYGYVNKSFSNAIPSNVTITYSSNRPWVVNANTSGTNITAVGGGVATITAVATDSITGKSAEGHFIVYVAGDSLDDFDVSLSSITAGDTVFTAPASGVYDFDVNIAKGVTAVPVVSAVLHDPDKSNMTITQATSIPGDALITVTDKEVAALSVVYRVHFGYMTIGALHGTVTSSSWDIASDVRFSDGVTSFMVIQAAYKDGVLVYNRVENVPALPKNAGGAVGYVIGDPNVVAAATGYSLADLVFKSFLWSPTYVPYVPAYIDTYQ